MLKKGLPALNLLPRRCDQWSGAASGFIKRSFKMRNTLKISIATASLMAIALSSFSARADGGGGGQTRLDAGGFSVRALPSGGGSDQRPESGFGGASRLFFPNMPISGAYMEDADTHDGEYRVYMGPVMATGFYGPDVPPGLPKIAIRKPAPRPGKPQKGPGGWTYFPQTDRNTGQPFVLIEDANGNDVHLDGSINVPGLGMLPVR
jgi:hypothetical protein